MIGMFILGLFTGILVQGIVCFALCNRFCRSKVDE